mgnify:CR=1 FL=1
MLDELIEVRVWEPQYLHVLLSILMTLFGVNNPVALLGAGACDGRGLSVGDRFGVLNTLASAGRGDGRRILALSELLQARSKGRENI